MTVVTDPFGAVVGQEAAVRILRAAEGRRLVRGRVRHLLRGKFAESGRHQRRHLARGDVRSHLGGGEGDLYPAKQRELLGW